MFNYLIKIFPIVSTSLSLLLFAYTFFQSEIFYDGEKRYFYNSYYIFSFTLIVLSIITFFLTRKVKEYLVIIFLSTIFTLYLAEAYLSFVENERNHKRISILKNYEESTGKKFDTRSKLEVYEKLKNEDPKITIAPIKNLFFKIDNKDFFALSGVSNSRTIYCNENGYYSIYESDKYGFNNPNLDWSKKEIEYFLVGDSFSHGACVNRPYDISSVLRKLSNKSVLNLGYGGNGPLKEYATLKEFLIPNVKKIIWLYFEENDLEDLDFELKNKILIKYLNNKNFIQNLSNKQKIIDDFAINRINRERDREKKRTKKKENFSFKIIKFVKVYNVRFFLSNLKFQKKPQDEFIKIMKLTKNLANENNSQLFFVYLPGSKRYETKSSNKNYLLIKNIIEELNIKFIDVHNDVFLKEKNPLKLFSLGPSDHYNEEGYKKVADLLFNLTKK